MNQDPGDVAVYMTIIHLPWSFKIVYGLISDNVPIFGYRRIPYLIISGFVQFVALMSFFIFEPEDPIVVALILCTATLSLAIIMVVSEAIFVMQSRLDPKFGS